jgi:cbb3-type cytochrome oxidase maturation protein
MLIPLTFVVMTLAAVGIFWAIRSGQYDDLDSPAHQILRDDDIDLMPDDAKPRAQQKTAVSSEETKSDDHKNNE